MWPKPGIWQSGVSKRAIASFEAGVSQLMRLNHEAIRQTLERAGVVFTEGEGVKLRDERIGGGRYWD